MKILLNRTSDWDYEEIKEYNSLEACVDKILSNSELFPDNRGHQVVVSKGSSEELPDINYAVEIYDDYRE